MRESRRTSWWWVSSTSSKSGTRKRGRRDILKTATRSAKRSQNWVSKMDTKLKVYQMNLEGEIDSAKMAEIRHVIGQLIKGEMYGLILSFEAVEHIHFTIL